MTPFTDLTLPHFRACLNRGPGCRSFTLLCLMVWSEGSGVVVMVFNATFNNISVISWRSVLLVEKTIDRPQATAVVRFADIGGNVDHYIQWFGIRYLCILWKVWHSVKNKYFLSYSLRVYKGHWKEPGHVTFMGNCPLYTGSNYMEIMKQSFIDSDFLYTGVL